MLWTLRQRRYAALAGLMLVVALICIALGSYFGTSKALHEHNQFSLAPIVEVAILFVGLFVCLVPIELMLGNEGFKAADDVGRNCGF